MSEYPKEFIELLESVKDKRPRTVIQHILEHGFITSQELEDVTDITILRVPYVMFESMVFL